MSIKEVGQLQSINWKIKETVALDSLPKEILRVILDSCALKQVYDISCASHQYKLVDLLSVSNNEDINKSLGIIISKINNFSIILRSSHLVEAAYGIIKTRLKDVNNNIDHLSLALFLVFSELAKTNNKDKLEAEYSIISKTDRTKQLSYLLYKAAEGGYKEILKLILSRSPSINSDYLQKTLCCAAEKNHPESVQAIIDSPQSITIDHLDAALFEAAAAGSSESIQKIIQCDLFNDIKHKEKRTEYLSKVCLTYPGVIPNIISCPKFEDMDIHDLGKSLQKIVRDDCEANSYKIVDCGNGVKAHISKLTDITSYYYGDFDFSSGYDSEASFKAILDCSLFEKIPAFYLEQPLYWTARCNREKIFTMILECSRSNDMTDDCIIHSLYEAAKGGYVGIVKAILNRFSPTNTNNSVIDRIVLIEAFSFAVKHGKKEIVEIFLNDRLEDIKDKVIELAKNDENIKTILKKAINRE